MGLLTNSKSLREKMLRRNIYTPDHIYDLGNDFVTRTLDTFAKLGMDLRTSTLLAGAERLIDNTKLGTIGLERLAVEIARRTANNAFRKEVGVINVDNLLSNDPNKKFITKPEDFSITPVERPTDMISYLKNAAGYEAQQQHSVAGKESTREESPAGLEYYNQLGPAQKAKLQELLALNNYNRFPEATDPYAGLREVPGRYTSVQDTYSPEFLDSRRQSNKYGTYIQEENGNTSLGGQTRSITTIAEATSAGVNNMRQIETEGFGRTSLPDHSFNGDLDDVDRFFQYGLGVGPLGQQSNLDRFGIKRGLLYYTQKLISGPGAIPVALDQETREYGVGERNLVVYRGSGPCRSFTMQNPLDSYGQAIRFKGNGNPESVVGDSVMPRIYPIGDGDKNRLMFSIENLAYSREDIVDIPNNERGPNDGRLMWFPPYALNYSISTSAQWDTTNLLGRIEPMYIYNGVTRQASISFMLLIDTPPNVLSLKKDELAQWFWGCLPEDNRPPAIDAIPPRTPGLISVPPMKIPEKPAEHKPDRFMGTRPTYYFQNDVHEIELDYESGATFNKGVEDKRNLFGLNATNFFPHMEPILRYIHAKRKDKRKVHMTIQGRCSALFTNIYNAKLSYRRASRMKDYILSEYQKLFGETLVLNGDFTVNDANTKITLENLGTVYQLVTKDGSLVINIQGRGEKLAGKETDEKKELNNKKAKSARLAEVTELRSVPLKPDVPWVQPPATPNDALLKQQAAARRDAERSAAADTDSNAFSSDNYFRSQYTEDTKVPKGWENVDYYAPMFHSQTPYDMYKRKQFLQQLMYPGDTREKEAQVGSNSLFGRMPVCIIRIADDFHSKCLVNNLSLDMTESTWDTNPEGMGMQPMFLKVTMDVTLIGGMSMKGPINRLQTATDFNHVANSSFYSDPYYSQERWDYRKADHGDAFRQADSRNKPETK